MFLVLWFSHSYADYFPVYPSHFHVHIKHCSKNYNLNSSNKTDPSFSSAADVKRSVSYSSHDNPDTISRRLQRLWIREPHTKDALELTHKHQQWENVCSITKKKLQ